MIEFFYRIINSKYLSITISSILFIIIFIELLFINSSINNRISNIECNSSIDNSLLINNKKEVEIVNETKEEFIYVDVKGEVKSPGVYLLPVNSIVNDAIDQSGGVTKNANTRYINLSKNLKDGDVIVVYSKDEIKKATKNNIIYVDVPCVCEEVKNDACLVESIKEENNTIIDINVNNTIEEINNRININTASEEELTSLTGIGSSKAKAIIEYRNTNGNFKTIEEIINVSGISETLFSKIKENITV